MTNPLPELEQFKPDWRIFWPPIGHELRGYSREKLRADLTAALTVTLVSLPQILGFALVLGLPPVQVLMCAIVGGIVAALFFSSKLVIFGVTNSVTLLVASAIQHTTATGFNPLTVVTALALLIGVIQVGAALLRLGIVTQFVSRSVIIAYSSATGVLLILTQLHNLFGLTRDRSEPLFAQLWDGAQRIAFFDFNPMAPLTGLLALLLFVALRAFRPNWPDILIGLVAMTLLFQFTPGADALGVKHLGDQSLLVAQVPRYTGVPFSLADLAVIGSLLSTAFAIAILGMLESVSLSKNLAVKHGERVDPNREIVSLGLGNIANALFGSVPGSASFVRSAVNAQAGAKSQVAGMAAAGFLLVAVLTLAPFLNHIPIPALAASLVMIGLRMIDTEQIEVAVRSTRSDASVLVVTFGAALFLPLDSALYIGAGLSLALALRKASIPNLVEYSFNESNQLASLTATSRRPHPQIAIIHVEGELFFGAADLFQEDIRRRVEADDLRVVILRLKSARHLDATTVFALRSLHDYLSQTGRHLLISGVHGGVLHVLRRSGLVARLGEHNVFPAEANPNMATKRALQRANTLVASPHTDVRLYFDRPAQSQPA